MIGQITLKDFISYYKNFRQDLIVELVDDEGNKIESMNEIETDKVYLICVRSRGVHFNTM